MSKAKTSFTYLAVTSLLVLLAYFSGNYAGKSTYSRYYACFEDPQVNLVSRAYQMIEYGATPEQLKKLAKEAQLDPKTAQIVDNAVDYAASKSEFAAPIRAFVDCLNK